MTSSDQKIHAKLIKIAKSHHPALADIIKVNGALSLEPSDEKDLFNFLARTVTGQQLSVAAARTIWDRLGEFSSKKNTSLQALSVSKNEEKLRACGLSKNKIKALISLRDSFKAGDISHAKIIQADYEDIISLITSLWGFGNWSADMAAMFYVRHPDVWPIGDAAIVRGVKKYLDDSVSMNDVADKYSPYRAYLARHIWKALDAEVMNK